MRALALLSLVLLMVPLALAHSYAEARYVGSVGDVGGARVCADTPHPVISVGGGCEMHVHGGQLRVSVADDAFGPFAFTWEAHTALGVFCAAGGGEGSETIGLATGCSRLTVIPALGATTGMIVAAFI